MGHWNYRVIKTQNNYPSGATEEGYTVHTVYYNSCGQITGVGETSSSPFGNTPKELKQDIKRYLDAFKKDILDMDKIVYFKPDFELEEDTPKTS